MHMGHDSSQTNTPCLVSWKAVEPVVELTLYHTNTHLTLYYTNTPCLVSWYARL